MYAFKKNHSNDGVPGFTLLELMITVAVTGLFLIGIVGGFLTQQRLYHSQNINREVQFAARGAMSIIEHRLSRAGFGIGPEFVFITDRGGVPDGPLVDNTDGPDELIFHAREPAYFSRLVIPDGSNLSDPEAEPGDPPMIITMRQVHGRAWIINEINGENSLGLRRNNVATKLRNGQILFASCAGGFSYAYVKVSTETEINEGDGTHFISLQPHVDGHPFRQNRAFVDDPCFLDGEARVFLINRYRFFIDSYGGIPYLMLDRGLKDSSGEPIHEPVAAGIEDLQVSYITSGGDEVWGRTVKADNSDFTDLSQLSGEEVTHLCFQSSEITWPFYRKYALSPCPIYNPSRNIDHVVNTRSVIVTLTARTKDKVRMQGGQISTDPHHAPANFSAENHNRTQSTPDGYHRSQLTAIIELPNMSTRGVPLL